jgi:hypothetical protein
VVHSVLNGLHHEYSSFLVHGCMTVTEFLLGTAQVPQQIASARIVCCRAKKNGIFFVSNIKRLLSKPMVVNGAGAGR